MSSLSARLAADLAARTARDARQMAQTPTEQQLAVAVQDLAAAVSELARLVQDRDPD